jgi:hypothetical protein
VIELASNDGYLLQFYASRRGISVLGIDPAAKGPVEAARKKGIETRHAFFTEAARRRTRQAQGIQRARSCIVGNNVLAHVADTRGLRAAALPRS